MTWWSCTGLINPKLSPLQWHELPHKFCDCFTTLTGTGRASRQTQDYYQQYHTSSLSTTLSSFPQKRDRNYVEASVWHAQGQHYSTVEKHVGYAGCACKEERRNTAVFRGLRKIIIIIMIIVIHPLFSILRDEGGRKKNKSSCMNSLAISHSPQSQIHYNRFKFWAAYSANVETVQIRKETLQIRGKQIPYLLDSNATTIVTWGVTFHCF